MCTTEPIHVYQGTFDIKSLMDKCSLKDQDTAINVCDLSSIVSQYDEWIRRMPNIMPYYALKCNNEIPVLKTLLALGTGLDCASKNEIEQALCLGFESKKIIFANPVRSISHIKYSKANNITDSAVDNEFEIYKIFKYYPESNVFIRYRSDAKKSIKSLGKKFGCDAKEDGVALMLLAKILHVNVKGLSFHVGSGCDDLIAYEKAIKTGSRLYKVGNIIKLNMDVFDIGGGFPGNDDELFGKIADVVNKSLSDYMSDFKIKVTAEPGRYFVTKAYTTICKIISKRELRDQNGELEKIMYYVNDGIYGTFPSKSHEGIEMDKIIHFEDASSETFNSLIFGPTCDPADMISDNIQLPNLNYSDLIAFPNMGAYSVSRSCSFNGFELPKTLFFIRKNDLQPSLEKHIN